MPKDMNKTDTQKFWCAQIEASKKRDETWRNMGDKIIQLYRVKNDGKSRARLNILYANTEILKPATLSRVSSPHITRRFKDEDPIALEVAVTLEKVCKFIHDEDTFVYALKDARDDFLLPGRGVVRFKYKAKFTKIRLERQEITTEEDDEDIAPEVKFLLNGVVREPDGFMNGEIEIDADDGSATGFIEIKTSEEIIPDYVHWKDFLVSDAKRWKKNWWVAFRHGMLRDELVDMFGKDRIEKVKLSQKEEMDSEGNTSTVYEVWEIWDKRRNKRIWFSDCADDAFGVEKVPLELKGFFPCPKPLIPFTTTDTQVPNSLYETYSDLAEELNVVNLRMKRVTEYVKVAGLIDSVEAKDFKNLSELDDGEFKSTATGIAMREKGGLDGAMWNLPMEAAVVALGKLAERAAQLKAEIFDITGIADIMRGHSDPGDSAAAQSIKGAFGTLRLRPMREPMEDMIKESYQIIAEIASDKFDKKTFQELTGKTVSDEAMQLMRNDRLRSFRIDVETDSTVIPNEALDRASAVDFATTMGSLIAGMVPVVQQVPQLAPLAGELVKSTARMFKAGRGLEDVLTKTIDQLTQAAGQGQQGQQGQQQEPPSADEQLKAQTVALTNQTKVHVAQLKGQSEQQKSASQERIATGNNQTTLIKNQLDVIAGGQG